MELVIFFDSSGKFTYDYQYFLTWLLFYEFVGNGFLLDIYYENMKIDGLHSL